MPITPSEERQLTLTVLKAAIQALGSVAARNMETVSYTHLTLPTTPYV